MSQINLNNIIQQVQQAQNQANAANESRYKQLISAIQGLAGRTGNIYGQIMNNIGQMGQTQKTNIARKEKRQKANTAQDLISRGLGNTTIRQSAMRGVSSDAQRALQNLAEQQANMRASALQSKAGSDQAVTGMLAQAIQARNDIGPNLSMYANLLQQAAAANQQNKKLQASIPASNQQVNGPGFGGVSPAGSGGGGGGGSMGSPSFGSTGGTGGSNGTAYVIHGNAQNNQPSTQIQNLAGQLGGQAANNGMTAKEKKHWQSIYDRGAGLISQNYDIWNKAKQKLGL